MAATKFFAIKLHLCAAIISISLSLFSDQQISYCASLFDARGLSASYKSTAFSSPTNYPPPPLNLLLFFSHAGAFRRFSLLDDDDDGIRSSRADEWRRCPSVPEQRVSQTPSSSGSSLCLRRWIRRHTFVRTSRTTRIQNLVWFLKKLQKVFLNFFLQKFTKKKFETNAFIRYR